MNIQILIPIVVVLAIWGLFVLPKQLRQHRQGKQLAEEGRGLPPVKGLNLNKKHWIVLGAFGVLIGWLFCFEPQAVAPNLFGGEYKFGIYFAPNASENVAHVQMLGVFLLLAGIASLVRGYLKEK